MGTALREVVGECLRSPLVSPYLIHYKPKARLREQIDAKEHWTSVTPDYLTKEFSKARDAAHAYDHMPVGERPTFHEIRALGACGRESDEALPGGARRQDDRVR